jgi:poly-gamma-glutamate capsule biosynthesis protein CapA/YwtB (metallophosphatase superfamily)
MHGAVKECAAAHRPPPGTAGAEDQGFGWLYEKVADLLSLPDVTFANLETPIAPASDKGARSYVFNAPAAAVKALAHAGVDVVNVANNHLFDQGRDGFLETLAQLDAAGMPYVGAGAAPSEAGPRPVTVNGLTIDFLGWARFFNESGNDCPPAGGRAPCVRAALLDPERAVAAVQAASATADAVVVSLHWGQEYAQQPQADDVELAHRLADAGALVILGHHPHVLQPVELYRRPDGRVSVIAYSLGNFISNQSRNFVPGVTPVQVAAPRDGALLRIEIARRDYGRGVSQVEIAGVDYLPLWTENDTVELDRRKDPKARPSIRVVSIDRALAEVRAELAAVPNPIPEPDKSRYVKLRQREQLYLARQAAIAAILGEDLQAVAPPPRVSSSTASR